METETSPIKKQSKDPKISKKESKKPKEIKEIEAPKEPTQLYKFRTDMAKLMNFFEWAEEREMKRVISEYIKKHNLYDKQNQQLLIAG